MNLAEAQVAQQQAELNHQNAVQAAAAAQSALANARAARASTLDAVADGVAGKSLADLAAADEEIRSIQYDAELKERLAQRARIAHDTAKAKLTTATEEDVKARLRSALDEHDEAGKALDAALAAAQAALESFNGTANKIATIHREAHILGARVPQGFAIAPMEIKLRYTNEYADPRGPRSGEFQASRIREHFGTSLSVAKGA